MNYKNIIEKCHSESRADGISPRKLPKTITGKIMLANVFAHKK